MLVCKVALPRVPVLLDYLPKPQTSKNDYPFGTAVKVPYRHKSVIGHVVATTNKLDIPLNKAKKINEILMGQHSITHLQTFYNRFCAYYSVQLSELFDMALPSYVWRQEEAPTILYYSANKDQLFKRSHLTQSGWRLYDWLATLESPQAQSAILDQGFRQATIEQCLRKQALTVCSSTKRVASDAIILNDEQQSAYKKIIDEQASAHYIYGVTGSGKTYLYCALAQHWIKQGGQVLILVPEIALTLQFMETLKRFLPPSIIGCLHSGLADQQRYHTWHACASGKTKLLVGTRSAIFTPMPQLSAIIMDEEHDLSYKQMSQIRYSARGVAFQRAQSQSVKLILGSATPSLACLKQMTDRTLVLHTLSSKYNAGPPVSVAPINTANKQLQVGFAPESLKKIEETLHNNRRVLIFLNRRGYSPTLWCPDCDVHYICEGCEKPMVYHQAQKQIRCHRCKVVKDMTSTCQSCQKSSLVPLGEGTEKVALFLTKRFPDTSVIKMDKDSCKTHAGMRAMLDEVHKPGSKIIVATQMLVKGHHIEGLDTVIVMGADHALYSKDFRAHEGLLAQMYQVIGRSGREGQEAQVLIQTQHPEHPIWSLLLDNDYMTSARELLSERKMYALPPYSQQISLLIASNKQDKTQFWSKKLTDFMREAVPQLEILGPVSHSLAMLNSEHRMLVILQSLHPSMLLSGLMKACAFMQGKSVRFIIDRDPVEL